MASNEIEERMIAGCWLGLPPVSDADPALDPDRISFRSVSGFKTGRIITTDAPAAQKIFVLELERVETRRETLVTGQCISTIDDVVRATYPADGLNTVLSVEPMHIDWLGPDLTNPLWIPFNLDAGKQVIPNGFDANLYNAVAVQVGVGATQDVIVTVWKLPRDQSTATEILQVLPVPA